MKLDLAHLERRGVPVAQQVADQPGIVAHGFRAPAVGHTRGLNDRGVVAHIVDHPDETVIEHRKGGVEHLFQPRSNDAPRPGHAGARLFDLGDLVGRGVGAGI